MSGPEQVFDWLDSAAQERAQQNLVRRLRPRAAEPDGLELAGNDYLGLARDKRVAGAAAAAALRWGAGATGSRLETGTTELHAGLEAELAEFCGAEAALVFSSGFAANLAAVTALSGRESAIVTDRYISASLVDGCRLSRADVAAVEHGDAAAVEHALSTRRRERALAVTDSVFSADGALAPLPALVTACRKHSAALLVDDGHGFGVLGDGGRGAAHEAGLAGEPDVVATISLSRALGTQGGAVLGPRRVIRHLVDVARSFAFDTALAPASVAAARTALDVLRGDPQLASSVLESAAALSAGLRDQGLRAAAPSAGIVAVPSGTPDDVIAWASRCAEQGVRVAYSLPHSVPDGTPRLRLTARADLRGDELDHAVKVVSEAAPHTARG